MNDCPGVEQLLATDPAAITPAEQVTVARNVFVPLTTACRYTCEYCTFYDPPGEATLLRPGKVREILRQGAALGCTEALFTFGDDPDPRYEQIHAQLAEWGYASIHEYLKAACEIALEEGLLPHANPGDQQRSEMATVAPVNASMGVMLETTADVRAHAGSRAKEPSQRIATIRTAGELQIPFTTGLLVGIGETRRDRAESLQVIAKLHATYDHIQEVIIQPVTENERWDRGSPDLSTLQETVAMARRALPETVAIQAPPNIAPIEELLSCGVDDLGGISPVTQDHINPEHAWPQLQTLRDQTAEHGVTLRERLPVHDRYLPAEYRADWFDGTPAAGNGWIAQPVREAIATQPLRKHAATTQ